MESRIIARDHYATWRSLIIADRSEMLVMGRQKNPFSAPNWLINLWLFGHLKNLFSQIVSTAMKHVGFLSSPRTLISTRYVKLEKVMHRRRVSKIDIHGGSETRFLSQN
jgi:hypothetical protein